MTLTSALIDIGGSSVKVTIRNKTTKKIVSHEISITPSVEGRHIFLNPDSLFMVIIQAMNKCAEKSGQQLWVEKIYISTIRQGFCLIDDSKEVTPLYLNNDTSGDFAKSEVESYGSEKIYRETGHWFAPQLTLPKLIYLMRTKTELKSKTLQLLFVHDWLVWKLTDQLITEMTLVSAGQMALISEKRIHTDLLEHFGISPDILPRTETFGVALGGLNKSSLNLLTKNWASANLCVGGGDSHFLHMGASGNQANRVVVSAGSSTPISLSSKTLGFSKTIHPWKSTSFNPDMYLLEGNIGYPGSFYGWLKQNVSIPFSLKTINVASISKAPKVFGACNMWTEKKWESRPAFSILGDHSSSTSNDLALGLTLDYAFALSNQISQFISDGFEVHNIILTGGGGNGELQKILRSLLNIPVYLISSEEIINNLFTILDGGNSTEIDLGNDAEYLDQETSHLLREEAINHALVYTQVEGTRKMLENAK